MNASSANFPTRKKKQQNAARDRNMEEYWADLIRPYRDADILDRDMLLKLIERIEVGEACVINGQKERQIRICYKFAGNIG